MYKNIGAEEFVSVGPAGKRFFNGFPQKFSDDFPPSLAGRIPEAAFRDVLQTVNQTVAYYWPCPTALVLGYVCCPATCGLSLLLPRTCVLDARSAVERKLRYYNKHLLAKFKAEARLCWQGCECRIDFHLLEDFDSFVSSQVL